MSNRSLIEPILVLFLPTEHVASIVGDVQEIARSRGHLWAVRAYASALFSYAARPLVALLGATILGGAVLYLLPVSFSHSSLHHEATAFQQAWASSCAVLVGLMSYVTFYMVILYGLRDTLFRTAAMLSVCGAAAVLFWWINPIPLLALCCAAIWLLAGAYSPAIRRSAIGLTGLIVAEVIIGMTAVVSLGFYGKFMTTSTSLIAIVATALYLISVVTLAAACSMIHRKIFRTSLQ